MMDFFTPELEAAPASAPAEPAHRESD